MSHSSVGKGRVDVGTVMCLILMRGKGRVGVSHSSEEGGGVSGSHSSEGEKVDVGVLRGSVSHSVEG